MAHRTLQRSARYQVIYAEPYDRKTTPAYYVITPAQLKVIKLLERFGTLSYLGLAQRSGIDRKTLYVMIMRLKREHLAEVVFKKATRTRKAGYYVQLNPNYAIDTSLVTVKIAA